MILATASAFGVIRRISLRATIGVGVEGLGWFRAWGFGLQMVRGLRLPELVFKKSISVRGSLRP